VSPNRVALLGLLLVALLVPACGGGANRDPSERPVTAAGSTSLCDEAGPSSLRAATCQATGKPSLDPDFSSSFAAPKVDRSGCTTSASVVFYAADDWMRLAQKLAADAYPCADYYISVPPTTGGDGTYTVPDPGQVKRIHALGSRFHAMAEIRVAAWQQWLSAHPGKTWLDAGIEARHRMEAAGYDPERGDMWAVNEFPLELVTSGQEQGQMRQLVQGLSTGGGGEPVKGLVFAVTPQQATPDLAGYKRELEHLLENTPFWREMSRSVRFWADEVYADSKSCCVGETTAAKRAAALNDYFFHRLTLVRSGPASVSVARSFLEQAFTPLANAAWAWTAAYGYTAIPSDQMQRFVAQQVYAVRSFDGRQAAQPRALGFAWAPLAPPDTARERFVRDSGTILQRMAASIDSSFRLDRPEAACGPGGIWCACRVPGSSFNDAWASFSSWG